MSINNIKSSIGTIDTYYLGEMISDLFQSLITSYRNQLFFPQISLPYPAGTSFTIPNVDYGNGYLVIYYNPEYAGMTNACLFEEQ